MPVEVQVALLTLLGTALVAGGAIIGHLLSARAQKRAATIQSEAAQATRENNLIDQLQEELSTSRAEQAAARAEQAARMTAQESRMNALEERNGVLVDRNDRYRDLLHKHRAHIWDQLPPPPPEWPDDLPR